MMPSPTSVTVRAPRAVLARRFRAGAAAAVAAVCLYAPALHGQDGRQAQDAEPRATTSADGRWRVERAEGGDGVRVLRGDLEVAVVRPGLEDGKPCVWPLRSLDGREMTRRYPLAEPAEGEAQDHPHHRSLWFAHGGVNGVDFWHAGGRTVHKHFLVPPGPGLDPVSAAAASRMPQPRDGALVVSIDEWRGPQDRLVAVDRRTLLFEDVEDPPEGVEAWQLTVTVAVRADGVLTFEDTKEGTFGIRVAPDLRLRGPVAAGHYLSSEGLRDGEVWGKQASWVMAWRPTSEDHTARGLVVVDHPRNPGARPTHWHARNYGLFAANPFGVHDFVRGKIARAGEVALGSGRTTFRYRVVVFSGATPEKDWIDAYAKAFREGGARGAGR